MSSNTWCQVYTIGQSAGTALTAAAAASMIPTAAKIPFPGGLLKIGDSFNLKASGIISCVVTTPGTARFDLRFGSVVVFDTGALNLNVVAKTNVPWKLDVDLTVRAVGGGTAANLWAQGTWTSEAVIASAVPASGSNGILNVPVSGLAVSSGFDSTTSFTVDSFFTQTVATGSLTCQQFKLIYET